MRFLTNLKQEIRFLLTHKWGLMKPLDAYTIPKGIFKKYLPENPTIIDCGSHVGADTLELLKIFPKAQIHCFEPVPEIYQQLLKNIQDKANVHSYNFALGDEDSNMKMYVSSNGSDGSSSLLKPGEHITDHPDVLFEDEIDVKVLKLDTFASSSNLKHIDMLWLDMQGFEYQMLKASDTILKTVKVIHTEISTRETYRGVLIYPEYKKWILSKGFSVLREAIPDGTDMGNVVFIRTKKN